VRVRVATLNAWGLPEPFSADLSVRMDQIGRDLSERDIDIIAFQEVWTRKSSRKLVKAGQRAGLHYAWHWYDPLASGGLLVLSRLPIISSHFESFDLRGQAEQITNLEYFSGKGFVRIVIETDAGPLSLIDTHLHARYGNSVQHAFAPHRIGQIVQLAEYAKTNTAPLILLGDFNFADDDPEYSVLLGLFNARDAAVEVDSRFSTTIAGSPYRKSNLYDKRKDYVFVRDGSQMGVEVKSLVPAFHESFLHNRRRLACSNHVGVLAEIELVECAAPALASWDHEVSDVASRLLHEGRVEAELRQRGERKLSRVGAGVGLATLAVAAIPERLVDRRNILRSALRATALLTLAPAAGYSLLSEVYIPDEIGAFRVAAERLAELAARRGNEALDF